MLTQTQKDMLAAAAKIAGRVQLIYISALQLSDIDTCEFIATNYLEQLDKDIVDSLRECGIITTH